MAKRIALFPGSFDPFTNGHLATVQQASKLFDHVTIAIMTNTNKSPLFTSDEKLALVQTAVARLSNVDVVAAATQLTVDLARQIGATVIIRGLRNTTDFEYEQAIAAMNKLQAPDIESVFLMSDPQYAFLSSSLLKEVAAFNGDIEKLVPKNIAEALNAKLAQKEG
ncbi:pantetheine-phosphate adenylyltransferase [Loigolactobacillus bifermentans]|jgi:pantetheine-phosphate adenylyltransferase|uniref:Phosphopantetheine adenylyltransferase n=1 Tax=Loigolactobacillus bifermentans DSM 20003 TaxID=1423726 RepID=A0A0R1GWU0_9LACO|nr:pantetheine-phosphate adenylyltransferase [Loigolactobacillus bifermentans]KRK35143.1 pantetheine-phosphate adenylyltransferase [Loigolactobacillus bifermentans DSM 20003]QGG59229.1 pantetheine-phosphate adenylyltransferase [Loigolactobacillus bifermentans]